MTLWPPQVDGEMDSNKDPTPQQWQDMLLNHIILPRYLPQFKSRHFHQTELRLLNGMVENVVKLSEKIPSKTVQLFEKLQKVHHERTPSNISSEINSLQPGDTFAMFVRRQNCVFIIYAPPDENVHYGKPKNVIVATFPGNLHPNEVYHCDSDMEYNYPRQAIKMQFSRMLCSEDFAKQLCFMYEHLPIETKNRNFVSKWLMTVLGHEGSRTATADEFPIITKKIRDEVLGTSTKDYFRRSNFYMSVKVLLQHSLTIQMGAETGKFLYKTLMLKFLIQNCKFYKCQKTFDIDLVSQMIAKMARRIEKLNRSFSPGIDSDLSYFCRDTLHEAEDLIQIIRVNIDRQVNERITMKTELPPLNGLDFPEDINQKMPKLSQYLRMRMEGTQKSNNVKYQVTSYQRFFISQRPATDSINIGKSLLGSRIFWIEFERMVLYEITMNDTRWSPDDLRTWAIAYTSYAESEYKGNQLFISRMVLVRLKIISVLDQYAVRAHPLLLQHCSGINPNIISSLLLPQLIDMKIAYELEEYFRYRNKNSAGPSLIGEQQVSCKSFSSKFATDSHDMIRVRDQILLADRDNLREKKNEWNAGRERVKRLRDEASRLSCEYYYIKYNCHHSFGCKKCRLNEEAEGVKIRQYEHLLPTNQFEQCAVVFELRIPIEIACLRDILVCFAKYCHPNSSENLYIQGQWNKDRCEISKYNQTTSKYVWLGSTTKRILEQFHVDSSFSTFDVANTYNCVFYENYLHLRENSSLPRSILDSAIKTQCTLQTQNEYTALQWTLNTTTHTQNQVLASQSKCPQNLSLSEYKNFGSLRGDGHRLQFRKLYKMIETEALSFEKESVLTLIMQTLWECGISGDANFIRESHIDFSDPIYCTEFIRLLMKFVNLQKNNWKHPFKMVLAVLITVRAFEINTDETVANEIVLLLNFIRSIALDWIDEMGKAIHGMENPDERSEREIRLKLIYTAIAGALTFFIHPEHKHFDRIFAENTEKYLPASRLWLQFVITMKNNVLMYTNNEDSLPSNLRMFLRLIESIAIYLERPITMMIQQDTTQVHDLIRKLWTRADGASFLSLEFHSKYPQILVVETMLGPETQIITIDIIAGIFLVDGLPVCRLPDEIMRSDVYRWFFADVTFEVQPDALNNFSSVQRYNGCAYDFQKSSTLIIITERLANSVEKELIHYSNFSEDFPYLLVNNYSHWWVKSSNCIEFRNRTFGHKHFSKEITVDYVLDLQTKRLNHVETKRYLLDINSGSYKNIVKQLRRLEHSKYIHVLIDLNIPTKAKAELVRMNLKFNVDASSEPQKHCELQSNEFSGMQVSRTQNVGTLYGLNNGLILESERNENTRILLIPHGRTHTVRTDSHVAVSIDTENELFEPRFFEYQMNEFCRQIKSKNTNFASWFYLAYLHAVTSYGQIEPFTGMSGTERAIQILQLPLAWSSAPYAPEAATILKKFSELIPKRTMNEGRQTIDWPKHIWPHAAEDCFVFIAHKLFEDSQRLHGLYFKGSAERFVSIKTEFNLNVRDHRRCQPLNPNLNVLDRFIEHKKLITSLPNQIPVSFSEQTQKVSVLYHRQQYNMPPYFDLKSFLNRRGTLTGLLNVESIFNILDHSVYDYFEDLWIRLYDAARERQFNNEQFALILTLYSHLGVDIDSILTLQSIAMNSSEFEGINPPSVPQYTTSDGICVNDGTISDILMRSYTQPHEYDSKEWDKTGKRKAHDVRLQNVINEVRIAVKQEYPCDSINLIGRWSFDSINFVNANDGINVMLLSWNNNRRLDIFIDQVKERLRLLTASGMNLELPRYSEFVPSIAKEWPKFTIDFENAIHENLDQNIDAINEAKKAWRTQSFTSCQTKTVNEWWLKIQNIQNTKRTKHLIEAGLFPRIIPSILLPHILTHEIDERLKDVIGAWAIAIVHEQRQIRIKSFSSRPDLQVSLQREIENPPHINWKPYERPEWLIFEIEQNLTIRRIQVEVANRMLDPPKKDDTYAKHSVMQLNMGEGKTAVIVPIVAAVLANGKQVCQITVLKSLFATNLNLFRQYLGGLLNRRIYTFPCRRDMPINQHISQMLAIYRECMVEKGVILTLPEFRLSFQLKLYESIQKTDINMSSGSLNVLKWLNKNVRNILDESDAILQPKYQLIYTLGNQMPPDGGSKRWLIAQALLKRVPHHMKAFYMDYGKDCIEFDANYIGNGLVFGKPMVDYRADVFTPCRILGGNMFDMLKSALIDDFLQGRLDIEFPEIVASMKNGLKVVLMNKVIDKTSFEVVSSFSLNEQQSILILSGLLRFEVLKLILTKRWRVNYGVDENGRRKMAIPFKAKDVAAEMTEFGHPDVAICFTQLSYYYSGLSDAQLQKVFNILENMQDAVAIYERWIQSIPPKLIDSSIQSYTGVNLDDGNQRDNLLFPLLRHNMHVIDFWLSNVVFPHEMKIFEKKLICTAWDLCSDHFEHLVTGFSGTNDTKDILPLPIVQNDLKELENTNEKMREVLLQPENQAYEGLPANISGKEILQRLNQQSIPVLLDAGALMLELNNKEVAVEWLKLSPDDKFDAGVYFDSRDVLQTIDRNGIVTVFDCSVYRENLNRCLVYLDEVHTRGTDLKFPLNWRACVTLSGDITRDKAVQSCMRMRQLGKNHRISFWAAYEADVRIRDLCNLSAHDKVTNEHVVEFICNNSKRFELTNMVHWTMAGLNYTKKLAAHKLFENSTDENSMTNLYRMCVDNEFVELNEMYGEKEEAFLTEIAKSQFNKLASNPQISDKIKPFIDEIQSNVSIKLNKQAPNLKQFTHSLDEEQEKELENEQEEQREVERPVGAQAVTPHFDERLKQLVRHGVQDTIIRGMKTEGALVSITDSLSQTRLFRFTKDDADAWADHILVTKDFKTVIISSTPTCDEFLRPVWWIAKLKNPSGQNVLILLSSYEYDRLMPIFRESVQATCFMYEPRLSRFHDNLLHKRELQVTGMIDKETIDIDDEVQIGVFSGMMYFNSAAEENAYCSFMGLIPRPRSVELEMAFEQLLIQPKGFVPLENRQHSEAIRRSVGQCKFKNNPVDLAIKLIEAHHQSLAKFSHAAFILIRGIKPNETWGNAEDADDQDERMN